MSLCSSKISFICTIPPLYNHDLCYTCRVAPAGTKEKKPTMKDRSDDPLHHERTLYHGATSRSHADNNCSGGTDFKTVEIRATTMSQLETKPEIMEV